MALPRKTGRTRTLTCSGSIPHSPDTSTTSGLRGSVTLLGNDVFGKTGEVFDNRVTVQEITFPAPPPGTRRFRISWTAMANLTGSGVPYFGEGALGSGQFRETQTTTVDVASGSVTGASTTSSGTITCSFQVVYPAEEWVKVSSSHPDDLEYYETISRATSGSISFSGSLTVNGSFGSVLLGFGKTFTWSTVTFTEKTILYTHKLNVNGTGVGTAVGGISGDGISYSNGQNSLTVSSGNSTLEASPDWAVSLGMGVTKYDGTAVYPTIEVYKGTSTLLGTTTTNSWRYPTSGFTNWSKLTVGASITDNQETLFKFGGTDFLGAKISDTWGDTNGYFFNNNGVENSKWVPWFKTPIFKAGTLQVASSHVFGLFNSTSGWSGATLTSGHLSFPAGTYNLSTKWKPFGYRYYKFSVKSATAGATGYIQLERPTRRTLTLEEELAGEAGPYKNFTAIYRWNFTINEANTWEEKEIDIGFPDEFTDGASFDVRYPVHPEMWCPSGIGTTGLGTFRVSFSNTTEIDAMTGFHKPAVVGDDTDRIKVLLSHYAPVGTVTDPETRLPVGFDMETYSVPASGSSDTLIIEQCRAWGRLIVNGLRGCYFFDNSGATPTTAWTTWKSQMDNDTGITITLDTDATNLFKGEIVHYTGVKPETSVIRTIDNTTIDLKYQMRGRYLMGYYGMGDITTGVYSPDITFSGDKWLDGEVVGIAHSSSRALKGIPLAIYDNPNDTLVADDVSNADGFYHIPSKYAVTRPYSNLPVSTNSNDRKQFTAGSGETFTYTVTGEKFNYNFLKSKNIENKDAEQYALHDGVLHYGNVKLCVLDRYASFFDIWCNPNGGNFLDTKRSPDGRVYTVWTGSDGTIQRLIQDNLNSMTSVVDTGIEGICPRIELCSASGIIYLYYVSDNTLYRVSSEDDTATWSSAVSIASDVDNAFPFKDANGIIFLIWVDTDGAMWLKMQAPNGNTINFPDGSTEKEITGYTATAAAGAVKSGIICVKYIDTSGDLQQIFSSDTGTTWGTTY